MKSIKIIIAAFVILFNAACQNETAKTSQRVAILVNEEEEEENDDSRIISKQINSLSENEKEERWKLLFDGKTTQGWRGAYQESFPEKGWVVEDGMLVVLPSGGAESAHGGDIIAEEQYANFELTLEFKITEGANSGIKYFVVEQTPKPEGSAIGLEFQILDDKNHPDAKMGRNGNRTVGSLYDLIPAEDKIVRPVGEWNTARILVRNNHVEHWLNGNKVLEYERGSEEFKDLIAISKYNVHQNFGQAPKGHILLQDHGDKVFFRNIKIREI